ncbi:MAG: hypothetical protein HY040_24320 [Planctomycetes bacterium]|nr:hypothetical protein [Planctomycetota bacterium]
MAELTHTRLTDFATLLAYTWYRDFPVHESFRPKAQRADWTTHIGIAVRSAADFMGLFTHFESGGRTDAILKDNKGHALAAIEWEWSAVHRGDEVVTEFAKLMKRCTEPECHDVGFACLIGYARGGSGRDDYAQRSAAVLADYTQRWAAELPPLMLVIIGFEWKGKHKGREFTNMTIDQIERGKSTRLREQPAYPWKVLTSRWANEMNSVT